MSGGPPLLMTTDVCPICGHLAGYARTYRQGDVGDKMDLECSGNPGHKWTRDITEPMPEPHYILRDLRDP